MKILVGPINLPGQIAVDAHNPNNPGIGGSEYHSIVLATILSQEYDVTLWLQSGSLETAGLRILTELSPDEDFGLQISFSSTANESTPKAYPLIAISHHPFDTHIMELPPRTLAIANVGDYQLKSNSRLARRVGIGQIWLPVFLRRPQANAIDRSKATSFTVGHVSSMHPSKGFHDVLSAWMDYLALGGKGTLEVLGGQSLYGLKESHPYLPVSKSYGEKLLAIMGGQVHDSVKFLGRVPGDIESRIASWDIAVLNPKGFGESESVSMKDCWREAVPVVAGNRFGQRDYMRLFPGLAASNPGAIAKIIKDLSEDPSKLESLQAQALHEYQVLFERGVHSGELWRKLAGKVAEGTPLLDAGLPTTKATAMLRLQIHIEGLQIKLQAIASSAISLLRSRKP
jgi:glycosyltransferase involved in cell wall biosynthesis